jgi:hypothetical protein
MMRLLVAIGLVLALLDGGTAFGRSGGSASSSGGSVHVRGYTTRAGTYVSPYERHPSGAGSGSTSSGGGGIHVEGYTTSKGTYVGPYERHRPGATTHFSQSGIHATARQNQIYLAHISSGYIGARDDHGRIIRNEAAKHEFMRMTGFPHGRPGYVVDHVIALKRGGPDTPNNMQWQTIADAKAKDRWE